MKSIVFQTKYKDIDAVALESSMLRAVFLPGHGAKLASLVDMKNAREFLVQAAGENYKKLEYGGKYIDAECSGFDDMFPNIDEYKYPDFPWQDTVMPDHGEVCGLPWHYEILESATCLHCWVNSVRFAYRLDKWIRFAEDNQLAITYEALNLSPYDFDFIWAGHLMLNAQEGAELLLPYPDGSQATCVFCSDHSLARAGDKLQWPQTGIADGGLAKLNVTGQFHPDGRTYKYYFDDAVPAGWCSYRYPDGAELTLSFDPKTVPYLGIWINEGSFKGYHNIAFEPCTGTFDDPGQSREHGQFSVLPANSKYAFRMKIGISCDQV